MLKTLPIKEHRTLPILVRQVTMRFGGTELALIPGGF